MNNNWKFVDLFAGIGGFHLALKSLGGKCVFSSEWDKNAQTVYEANLGIKPKGDITKINEANIPIHDVLCAGFPCQAFSISGKQLGFEDTRGTLFFDIARIVKYHKPKVVFMENVKNFAKHNQGKTLETVTKIMKNLGYNPYCQILKSSHFRLPQARERIYIICLRKDIDVDNHFQFPLDKMSPTPIKNILSENVSNEFKIKRNDISFHKNEYKIKNPYSPLQIGKINKGGQGERIYSIHSVGITLSAYGGGAAAKTGAYFVDGTVRKLTPKECLKMQGFPINFKLPSSKNIAYKLLGNSVSLPVIKRVFEEVLKQKDIISGNYKLNKKKITKVNDLFI